jgi:shikimate kinase/3-dehydroquinate synthase
MQIFLIGLSGVGKTTLGKKLSEILDIDFFDMDEMIEKQNNMRIKDIFKNYGESRFRDLESELLFSLKDKEGIIATGGGVILNQKNRNFLKEKKSYFIYKDVAEIINNLETSHRPLLKDKNSLLNLWEERKDIYNEFEEINISGLNIQESTAKILNKIYIKEDVVIDKKIQNTVLKNKLDKDFFNKKIIISDDKFHNIFFSKYCGKNIFKIKDPEENKKMETVMDIIDFLIENDVDRSNTVEIYGGGATTDIAAFACSIYKRGIRYSLNPTTLLSQVDASIGGKNGVNYKKYKNIIENINIPEKTYINTNYIMSLDNDEYINGLIEIIKIFILTEQNIDLFLDKKEKIEKRKLNFMTDLIVKSIEKKLNFVSKDKTDKNIRMALNYGHTLGHAFESITNNKHGFSVAWGIKKENLISKKMGFLSEHDFNTINDLLKLYIDNEILNVELEKDELLKFLKKDKKNDSGKIKMPLLKKIGEFDFVEISPEEVVDLL